MRENRFWMRPSNSVGVISMRLGRSSSPESTSVSSMNRGSTMSNSRTGRTGASSVGFRDTPAPRFCRHTTGSTRDRSSSAKAERVVRTETRHGRICLPVAGSTVVTSPLKTTVST